MFNIKEEREKINGLTQEMVSAEFGMSVRQYQKYESGKVIPKPYLLDAFKRYFESKMGGEQKDVGEAVHKNGAAFTKGLHLRKLNGNSAKSDVEFAGVPVFDIPIDASFLETFGDNKGAFDPVGFLNIPKLKNCNFAAIVSGSSMYPIMKSGTIAACRIVETLDYFDEGEMYLISTTNGFETVKYMQSGDDPNEIILIPHNEKIKHKSITKDMIIRVCIVEAWLNFR